MTHRCEIVKDFFLKKLKYKYMQRKSLRLILQHTQIHPIHSVFVNSVSNFKMREKKTLMVLQSQQLRTTEIDQYKFDLK